MVLSQTHEIPGGIDELNSVAWRLHGKRYISLTDTEAIAVWNDIDSRKEGQPE